MSRNYFGIISDDTAVTSTIREMKIHAYVNLYHVTKFSPSLSFTVYYLYSKISRFKPVLSIRIALDSFYVLIFYSEEFST